MSRRGPLQSVTVFLLLLTCGARAQDTWREVRSPYFVVYTNAGDKRGRDVTLRFELMRRFFGTLALREQVNFNAPLVIIAFKDAAGLRQMAPLWQGKPIDMAGIFLPGDDKNFIAIDASADGAHPVVFHEYAHLMLNANYPRTHVWFDEGFAEYYSTIRITPKEVKVGEPPASARILADGMMPISELFAITPDSPEYNEKSPRRQLLYAQSWLVVHYFYAQRKFNRIGEYFDLVINKKMPIPEAAKSAFGMTPQELDAAVQQYYRKGDLEVVSWRAPEIASSLYNATKLKPHQALEQIADFHLHHTDYFERAKQEFEQVLQADPNSAEAHRGLGHYYLVKKDKEEAERYFRRAAALASKDGRVYYHLAQFIFENIEGSQTDMADLQEMSALLDRAIELAPEFAEAYNLKAFVLSGARNHTGAIEVLRRAVQLSPRDDRFRANLATQYMLAGKYDEAIALWERLRSSENAEVATRAAQQLEQARLYKEKPLMRLQTEVREATAPQWRPKDGKLDPELKKLEERQMGSSDTEEAKEEAKPDNRPVRFIKGNLSRVECKPDGSAVLTVASGQRTLRLHTPNPEKMLIIGDFKFACNWRGYKVAVNYKARDARNGDIVSLEVQ